MIFWFSKATLVYSDKACPSITEQTATHKLMVMAMLVMPLPTTDGFSRVVQERTVGQRLLNALFETKYQSGQIVWEFIRTSFEEMLLKSGLTFTSGSFDVELAENYFKSIFMMLAAKMIFFEKKPASFRLTPFAGHVCEDGLKKITQLVPLMKHLAKGFYSFYNVKLSSTDDVGHEPSAPATAALQQHEAQKSMEADSVLIDAIKKLVDRSSPAPTFSAIDKMHTAFSEIKAEVWKTFGRNEGSWGSRGSNVDIETVFGDVFTILERFFPADALTVLRKIVTGDLVVEGAEHFPSVDTATHVISLRTAYVVKLLPELCEIMGEGSDFSKFSDIFAHINNLGINSDLFKHLKDVDATADSAASFRETWNRVIKVICTPASPPDEYTRRSRIAQTVQAMKLGEVRTKLGLSPKAKKGEGASDKEALHKKLIEKIMEENAMLSFWFVRATTRTRSNGRFGCFFSRTIFCSV